MSDMKGAIDKIFKATKNLIETHGYTKVSKLDIASEAVVDVDLIDRYFPDGKLGIIKVILQKNSIEFLDKVNFSVVTIKNLPKALKFLLKLYLEAHYENAKLLATLESAFLLNRELFKGYEDIFSMELAAAPLIAQTLKQFGFVEGKDFEDLVKLIVHTLDSLVHRHVIFEKIVEDDNVLIDFLISLSVGFIDYSVKIRD